MFSEAVLAALLLAGTATPEVATEVLRQSTREIPVAYDVDVVVVGGSTGAVSAAVAAAQRGARVFLAAPHPYLGDDMTATLQLWLEEGEQPTASLAQALYDDPESSNAPMPRPLHVKQTLERALLDAGVESCSAATRPMCCATRREL